MNGNQTLRKKISQIIMDKYGYSIISVTAIDDYKSFYDVYYYLVQDPKRERYEKVRKELVN